MEQNKAANISEWQNKKIAVVCDWLFEYGGSERVVEQILLCCPDADLFALTDFVPEDQRGFLQGRKVHTSFLQKLPGARTRFWYYLWLMPLAIEQIDLSHYDIVISISHAVAKGVLVGPDQLHISYVQSPLRYAWDMQHTYLAQSGMERGILSMAARWMLHKLRNWDVRSANGVDYLIANSGFIRRRMAKTYRRESTVMYPPVDIARFVPAERKQDYYVTVSRLVYYKHMQTIVKAFALMPDKKLIVIGDGPERAQIEALLTPNIEMKGFLPTDEVVASIQGASAFLFAALEDFGIAPIEAQACGTPVIAYGKGGATETVRGLDMTEPTGVFFTEQTPESICAAVRQFEALSQKIEPIDCRKNAERFSNARFCDEFTAFVSDCWRNFRLGFTDRSGPLR
ncbi:glycosyltransferase [Silvimonas amylolytica]|uniref:glycosyltransferase n=1 Tax=Silvimonas amylolytica TaxID=449663 RepID=UPI001E56FC97|nr:glycosyltransferase [Silvimonas amylolytica]